MARFMRIADDAVVEAIPHAFELSEYVEFSVEDACLRYCHMKFFDDIRDRMLYELTPLDAVERLIMNFLP